MQLQGKALRVTIYIGESDHYQGKSLFMALLQLLKQEGASGATVVRGLAGFGAKSRIHTATILDLSADLPIKLEWIDQPETVERLLPVIRQMVDDGLITLEEINVVQYAPGRRPDPLTQPVRDVMRRELVKIGPETAVTEMVTLLLQHGYRSLPVVEADGRLIGIVTDGDLLRRAGLLTRLDLQSELSSVTFQEQLQALRQRSETAADIMTAPVITVSADTPLREAAQIMVEYGLKRLPVVSGGGQLVGWISRVDLLRTLEYHQSAPTGTEQPATGGSISELMYQDVPTVKPEAPLEQVLAALEQSQRRRVLVIDSERRVKGIISDGDLLQRSQARTQPGLLTRLRSLLSGQPSQASRPLLDAQETAAELMTTPVITIAADEQPAAALRLMLQHQIKRLPVVDGEGRLLGLLGRASLLRGLLEKANGGQAGEE